MSIQRQIQGHVNSKTVEVSPKYESARTVYLPDDLVRVLAAHVEKHPADGGGAVAVLAQWLRVQPEQRRDQWRSLRAKVGMEAFTLHDLRHYLASGLIADGCDVVTVQHALGHSSASITLNVYSSLAEGGGPDAVSSGQPHRDHGRSCGLCADSGRFLSVSQR